MFLITDATRSALSLPAESTAPTQNKEATMAKVLVLYYFGYGYGYVETMAGAVAEVAAKLAG